MKVIYKSSSNEERTRDFFNFHLLIKKKTKYIYYALSLSLLLISILLIVFKTFDIGIILLFSSIFIILIRPVQVKYLINRTIKNISISNFEYTIIFTDQRIDYDLFGRVKSFSWDCLDEVSETQNYYYFYIKKDSALIVSKSNLEYNSKKILMDLINFKITDNRYKRYKHK